jgi:hypothetical protein
MVHESASAAASDACNGHAAHIASQSDCGSALAASNILKPHVHTVPQANAVLRSTTHTDCTALHCTALHCTALHCTALHCTALHCTALHCTALHYTTLYQKHTRPDSRVLGGLALQLPMGTPVHQYCTTCLHCPVLIHFSSETLPASDHSRASGLLILTRRTLTES